MATALLQIVDKVGRLRKEMDHCRKQFDTWSMDAVTKMEDKDKQFNLIKMQDEGTLFRTLMRMRTIVVSCNDIKS